MMQNTQKSMILIFEETCIYTFMLWSFYNIGLAAFSMYKFLLLPPCIRGEQHLPYSTLLLFYILQPSKQLLQATKKFSNPKRKDSIC